MSEDPWEGNFMVRPDRSYSCKCKIGDRTLAVTYRPNKNQMYTEMN